MATTVLGMVIGGLIIAVLLGAFMPLIGDTMLNATGNITGATATLLSIVPMVLIIVVVIAILGIAGLKVTGKM